MGRGFFILAIASVALMAACRKAESPDASTVPAQPEYQVRKSFGSGPVRFTIQLSASEITTADALKCRMILGVAEGYEAEFPDIAFPDDVPGFVVTGFEEKQSSEGDRRTLRRDYELEPEYEGQLTLPKMEIYSHRTGEVNESVLETEPIEITVKSTHETAGDVAFKPMRGLVTVEQIEAQERRVWPWVAAGVAGVAVLALLGVYIARRPRPAATPPPAHETALRRLRALAERGLIAAGASEAFFVEVTSIIRDYIEAAFGVRAPEQTTEEFLADMVAEPRVARYRHVLEPFLVAADEVKFAGLRPDAEAMQRAFDTAEQFVIQSSDPARARREPELVGAGAASGAGGGGA
ncbi:MAG: hypothetical protein AMXMBFR13_38780 [Phycisphaerae bacterium]